MTPVTPVLIALGIVLGVILFNSYILLPFLGKVNHKKQKVGSV